jgi:quercetin dioxygenase-like cupin family protein
MASASVKSWGSMVRPSSCQRFARTKVSSELARRAALSKATVSQLESGGGNPSVPHAYGTVEHVVLISGTALVGPASSPVALSPGDYLCYPGDAPHIFDAQDKGTIAVLISELR